MSNKILFLDLDGTVRRTKSGATFINLSAIACILVVVCVMIRKPHQVWSVWGQNPLIRSNRIEGLFFIIHYSANSVLIVE